MKNQLVELPIPTRDGQFTARYSEKGLTELDFPSNDRRRRGNESRISSDSERISRTTPHVVSYKSKSRDWHRATEAALKNILAGRAAKNLPPLDLSGGTEFQKAVWRELRKISFGKTKSYGEIAQAIGKAQGRPRRRRRVRRESDSGFGSLPSRAGGAQKIRRLFRRIGLETQLLAREGVKF